MSTAAIHHSFFAWLCNWHIFLYLRKKKDEKTKMDTDRMDIPEEDLMEFIGAVLPQLRKEKVAEQIAWKGTKEKLPHTNFEEKDVVVWDDNFISPHHGARMSCGEGPFTIFVVNDYIIAVTRNANGGLETRIPTSNRIALMTPNKTVIVTHPGYFKLFEVKP